MSKTWGMTKGCIVCCGLVAVGMLLQLTIGPVRWDAMASPVNIIVLAVLLFYMIALIRSNHEPSTHLLHDMEAANIHLSQWSQCYLMLFQSQEDYANFDRKEFDDLPSNVLFGVADPETIEAMHIEELTHGSKELPLLMLCDTFNRVYWIRQGYNIGLADQLMDALRKIILRE